MVFGDKIKKALRPVALGLALTGATSTLTAQQNPVEQKPPLALYAGINGASAYGPVHQPRLDQIPLAVSAMVQQGKLLFGGTYYFTRYAPTVRQDDDFFEYTTHSPNMTTSIVTKRGLSWTTSYRPLFSVDVGVVVPVVGDLGVIAKAGVQRFTKDIALIQTDLEKRIYNKDGEILGHEEASLGTYGPMTTSNGGLGAQFGIGVTGKRSTLMLNAMYDIDSEFHIPWQVGFSYHLRFPLRK